MTQRYFVEPATPLHPARYCLLQGRQIVRVQASRPDGIEIPRPADAVFALPPSPEVQIRPTGAAVRGEDFMRKRRRA